MLKTCGMCRRTLRLTEFHRNAKSKDGRQNRCKDCHKAAQRAVYAKDPHKIKERVNARAAREPEKIARNGFRRAARGYGLDPDDVEAKFKAHGGLCDICGKPPDPAHKRNRRLHIDHDHVGEGSVRFRGFLCHGCNTALGGFKDDPIVIAAAIEYLAAHGTGVI